MLNADVEHSEYILWMGTFPGATGKSFQGLSKRVLKRLQEGSCHMDVLDPVLGNGCVTPTIEGITWTPIRTATNSAFSCAAIQWMMDHDAHDTTYLSFPNYEAAFQGGYASCTNATHLVVTDETSERYRMFLRPEDIGLEVPEGANMGKGGKPVDLHVVIDRATGQPAIDRLCESGELEFEGVVQGVAVRSAYLFLKDAVYEKTIEEFAAIANVPADDIARIAKEFTSHGTKAAARCLGGSGSVNGLSDIQAMSMLNAMIGSCQMTGGDVPWRVTGDTFVGSRYDTSPVEGMPDVSAKNAKYLSRTNAWWHETDECKNRKAAGEADPKPLLPWYIATTGGDSDTQALISLVHQYPYQAKIMMSWMTNTLQCSPGALRDEIIDRLKDPAVVPLHIACDVVIGEHAQLADYIVPDTNPFESFGVWSQEGHWTGRGNVVRWPAKDPGTIELPDGRHASYEAFVIDVAKACDLPAFGDGALVSVDGTRYPLNDASDFFLKAVANLAYTDDPVADVSPEDVHLQALDELPAHWKRAVTAEEWPKVLNVLSRGGRFWPVEVSLGEGGRHAFAEEYHTYIYSEARGMHRNCYTGEYSPGTLAYKPQRFGRDLTPLTDRFSEEEYPFVATNYKPRFRSVSMLANSPIMRDLCEHNYLELNDADARELGIHDGDEVRAIGPTGDVMQGVAMVRAGIAPKTIGVAFGYGHRSYGAQDVDVDGKLVKGDPAIGAGIHLQTMLDPTMPDVVYPLADVDTGSPARNGCMFKIEKA